jgi:ferredoxin
MQAKIRDIALELGFIDARPATGHPFDVWRKHLDTLPLGKVGFSIEHDVTKTTGWPLGEITIWAAIGPAPPVDWPEGCGDINGYYLMNTEPRKSRFTQWKEAVAALGYEIAAGIRMPDRAAAIRAGLGLHGRNGLMITPGTGSFTYISVLVVRSAPPPDARGPEHDLNIDCGNCGACIPACPAGAITGDGYDATRCLRHYMNHLDELPEEDYPKMGRRIIGCEDCQYVCPHNAGVARTAPPAEMVGLMKLEKLLSSPDIERMGEYAPKWALPRHVPPQAVLAAANTGRKDLLPRVEALIGSEDAILDKVARWAAERLR